MRTILIPLSVFVLAVGTLAVGCSGSGTTSSAGAGGGAVGGSGSSVGGNSASSGGTNGEGGAPATAGTESAGGVTSAGSTTPAGGTKGSGGTVSAGGTISTSGSTGIGGSSALGGTTANGGKSAAGGTKAAGGTEATGGDQAAGGNAPTGGTKTNGGAQASGGNAPTGGTKTGGSAGAPGGTTAVAGAAGGGTTAVSTSTGTTTTIPGSGCTPPAAYGNLFVSVLGQTQADSDAKVAAAWSALFDPSGAGTVYKDGPGADESYVDDYATGDVRTEGMGYGMMAAVQLNHQTEFDRLWTWVKNHMVETNQIAWSCSTSGSKNSTGGAPDGDEYFAAALIFAHTRWGDAGKYNYKTEAQWTLNLLRTQDYNTTYNLIKFDSGSDNGQTDPSYIIPAFNQVFACFDTANSAFWNSTVTASRAFFPKGMDANGQFGDQMTYTGGKGTASNYDAQRCVMNIMMDWNFFAADSWQKDTYATTYAAHEGNINGGAQAFCNALLGFALPASSGKPFVQNLWSAAIPSHDYWNGTLYMLTLLHVSGTFQLWY